MSFINISQNNEALKFIEKRIKSENYRGSHHSQHNRYTIKQMITVLKLLDKHMPDDLMIIRTKDISKRQENTVEESIYATFCDEAKEKAGIGTQDAMRKNLFVDMHRMGLIERYNKKKERKDPYKRSVTKYVGFAEQGKKLIDKNKNELERYLIYSKAIDKLLNGYVDIFLNLFSDDIKYITLYEYMFFISAINVKTDFSISSQESLNLVTKHRSLSIKQKKYIVDELKQKMNPKNYDGTKKEKRDFHNWKNEAQQVFYLLGQTAYFEFRDEKIVPTTDKKFDNKLKRSQKEKMAYFKNHYVEKQSGFELHHVVPLSWSESIEHFTLLDKWENMLYIDAFSHAKITQNKNRNVQMEIKRRDITLKDFRNKTVELIYKKNVSYHLKKQNKMKEYNRKLLEI